MAYATLQNLKDRAGVDLYAALTDLAGGSTASDAVGQLRLDDAEGEVNGYLGRRWQTPVDVSDATRAATLRDITTVIARHKLYAQHPARPLVPKDVEDEYAQAIKQLEGFLSSGTLPGATEPTATPVGGSRVEVFGNDAMLTMDRMSGLG